MAFQGYTGYYGQSASPPPSGLPSGITPIAWVDAQDTATITESGGLVSQWDDKSGNGYHFIQNNGTLQPTTGVNNINGFNVIHCNIDQMRASVPSGVFPSSFHVIAVFQTIATTGLDALAARGISNNGYPYDRYNNYLISYGLGGVIMTNIASLTSPTIISNLVSGSTNRIKEWNNGTLGADHSVSGTYYDTSSEIKLGSRNDNATQSISNWGEFIFTEELQDLDRQKLEGYLAHKWGLTGNLPVGHPYKITPP